MGVVGRIFQSAAVLAGVAVAPSLLRAQSADPVPTTNVYVLYGTHDSPGNKAQPSETTCGSVITNNLVGVSGSSGCYDEIDIPTKRQGPVHEGPLTVNGNKQTQKVYFLDQDNSTVIVATRTFTTDDRANITTTLTTDTTIPLDFGIPADQSKVTYQMLSSGKFLYYVDNEYGAAWQVNLETNTAVSLQVLQLDRNITPINPTQGVSPILSKNDNGMVAVAYPATDKGAQTWFFNLDGTLNGSVGNVERFAITTARKEEPTTPRAAWQSKANNLIFSYGSGSRK